MLLMLDVLSYLLCSVLITGPHCALKLYLAKKLPEYWKYFVARFNDVHAFGYNSAGSEQIWMKFGELRVYCLELALTDFGRDPRRSESGRPCGSFAFLVR